jgi:hypothetical protein
VKLNTYTNSKNVERYVDSIGGQNSVAWVDEIYITFQGKNTSSTGYTNLWTHDTWNVADYFPKESSEISTLSFAVKNPYGTLIKLGINAIIALHNSSLPIRVDDIINNGNVKGKKHTFDMELSNYSDFSTTDPDAEPTYYDNESDGENRGAGTKYRYESDLRFTKGYGHAKFQAVRLVSSDNTAYQGYYASHEALRTFTIEF